MYLSRIRIENFRNFSALDTELRGNVVVVGENRVGKSNLIYALRLVFDPALPDSSRQLALSDFWDGLDELSAKDKITVSVEIKDFEDDADVLALLTDFRLNDDPHTARLTYEFRPKAELKGEPSAPDDYDFICYGGQIEANRFGYDFRRRICMDVLPALRDAEGDLSAWRRSPLRPLIDEAFRNIDQAALEPIGEAIEEATEKITDFPEVKELEESIGKLFAEMSGPRQDVKPRLGISALDVKRLHRNIQLLIDEGERGIADASLGSANLVFLTLKMHSIKKAIEENARDYSLLAIEEPEAHLHPHLQRSVYRHLFESAADNGEAPLSIFLTTHSPHIASVAPLRSLLLLKETDDAGTIGSSSASVGLSESEADDIARYLDVTRAEMLFARGVLLVEGDAERFLVPAFAKTLNCPLDHLGITVCSVAGTNFQPYVKFLSGLRIPFALITDWDPRANGNPLGYKRSLNLVHTIETIRTGEAPEALIEELEAIGDMDVFGERCEEFGVFTNRYTLEIDLFEDEFAEPIIATLREHSYGPIRQGWIDAWEEDRTSLDADRLLKLIDAIGKGRFAQRLISNMGNLAPPDYIKDAIEFVVDRV